MKDITHLHLSETIKRMARMAAAHRGLSVSQYVAAIIEADCEQTGIAKLAAHDVEVRDER